jgi:hypothetical protein
MEVPHGLTLSYPQAAQRLAVLSTETWELNESQSVLVWDWAASQVLFSSACAASTWREIH